MALGGCISPLISAALFFRASICCDHLTADLKPGSPGLPWPHGSNTTFIHSFHPLHPPSPHPPCPPFTCLSVYPSVCHSVRCNPRSELYQIRVFPAKACPCQLLWSPFCDDRFCFHVQTNPILKIHGDKNIKRSGEWRICAFELDACVSAGLVISECLSLSRGNNCVSRWTVKMHPRVNFISYVLLISPLI